MNWPNRISAAIAILATAVTAGCGQEPETGPAVDISALQPGNYRTTPREVEEVRKPENIDAQEALRLAKFVPLIMETEPKLIFRRIVNQQNLFTQLNPPQFTENFTVDVPGFVVGWTTRGQRREDELHGRAVTLKLLRYSTSDQATHAANYLADHYLNGRYPPKGPTSIPDHPSARAYIGQYDGINAWVSQGEYMVEIEVGPGVDIPPDPAPLANTAKAVLDKQFASLEGYQPTPVDMLDDLPVDHEEIIRYTLPAGEKVPEVAIGPDVALHLTERPDLTKRAFQDAGVDLLSLADGDAGVTVYRTSDSAAADRLKAFFISQLEPELEPVDSPPGLPTASCVENPEETQSLACYFSNGRYAAYIKDAIQIQELHQKTAAQYLLLNEAPQ